MTEKPPLAAADLAGVKVHKSFRAAMNAVSAELSRQHKAVHAKLVKKAADRREGRTR